MLKNVRKQINVWDKRFHYGIYLDLQQKNINR